MSGAAGAIVMISGIDAGAPFGLGEGGLREKLMSYAGFGLTTAILLAVLVQLRSIDSGQLAGLTGNPWIWPSFALFYAIGPLTEWWILRRLWGLRIDALLALFRKQVTNEIVFGYSGDAHFYLWARRNRQLNGSVFGTLRDVTVLSALAGNLATLVMMAVNARLLFAMAGGPLLGTLAASVTILVLSSLAILAARRFIALFTLTRRDLAITFAIHCVRIALSILLGALLWKLLLPGLSATMLVAVSTLRMMVHRLPLIPAREALLAPLILVMLGPGSGLPAATMMIAALVLATHILVGGITSFAMITPWARTR